MFDNSLQMRGLGLIYALYKRRLSADGEEPGEEVKVQSFQGVYAEGFCLRIQAFPPSLANPKLWP